MGKRKDKEDLEQVKWRKITAPGVWRPVAGEELIGYFVGRTQRDGTYGQYEVVIVAVPYKGSYTISGTGLLNLIDSGAVERGDPVRIVFNGYMDLEGGKQFKEFELYVGEGGKATDLPDSNDAPVPRKPRRDRW